MLRRATLLLLLVPGLALGQTVSGTVTAFATSQGTRGQANRADCASDTEYATWNISNVTGLTISAGDKWRLATLVQNGNTGCSATAPTGIQDVLATGTTQAITQVPVKTMATAAPVGSCTAAADVPIYLCVYYQQTGTTTWTLALQGTFNFQLAIPPAPVIQSSTPGDSELIIAVTPGAKTASEQAETGITYTVTCTATTAGGASGTGKGAAGNITCAGLTNSVPYTVTAQASSTAGNPGPVSATYPAGADTTPLPFSSFWEIYKGMGGVETGGCGTGGAGALAPALALLAFLGVRRRRP